jgi:F420-dependent oxidoreductase-like protein
MIRAGFQIPNFTYPDTPPELLFERVSDVAVAAEEAGFDSVFVMDHFYQLPLLGPPEYEMLEGYTLLAAIAARTARVRLGTLVTGVTYRNPAVLAKIVTTLDVVSSGRAILGIGAAWYDVEHNALGVTFPPVRERFEMLEEALAITTAMFRGERPTIEGAHFQVRDAINSPLPVQVTQGGRVPVLIGGQGERKTLRLMAQHADIANFTSGLDEIPHKLEVLAGHCDAVGRDYESIARTPLWSLFIAPTMESAAAKLDDVLEARGMPPWGQLDDGLRAMIGQRFIVGDPDSVGEQIESALALGLTGIVVNMPADGHDVESVILAGETLSRATA